MGRDVGAMLFYGFSLGNYEDDEDDVLRDIADNWNERYFAAMGIPAPPEPTDWQDQQASDVLALHEYLVACREKAPPFSLELYGSDSATGWALVCAGLVSVEWSEVAHPAMPDYSYIDEQVEDFCQKAQIPYQKPQWCLVAKYF
jgi:hypothetical protein